VKIVLGNDAGSWVGNCKPGEKAKEGPSAKENIKKKKNKRGGGKNTGKPPRENLRFDEFGDLKNDETKMS